MTSGDAIPATATRPSTPGASAAQAADILALGRAALDAIGRALRSAPEVRANRVMARWPLDLEDLLLELEPMQVETPITELAARLGVSTAQLRSTAIKLQRLSLVKVSSAGVALTATGRQKLARLELARAAVLRRIARGLDELDSARSKMVIEALNALLDHAERIVEEQLGQRPSADRRSVPPRGRAAPQAAKAAILTTQGSRGAGPSRADLQKVASEQEGAHDTSPGHEGPSPPSGNA